MFEPPIKYPYTDLFDDLTEEKKVIRLTTADALLTAMEAFMADEGTLNPWERAFLTSIYDMVRRSEGRVRLSKKVWAKLNQIADVRWEAALLFDRIVERLGDPTLTSWQQDLLELIYGKYTRTNGGYVPSRAERKLLDQFIVHEQKENSSH